MKSDDHLRDPGVTDALRRFDRAPNPSIADLRPLMRRIATAAEPLMPGASVPQSWWEFPAIWARTLIPIGVATAVVGIGILWTTHVATPATPAFAVLTEANEMSAQRMLYSLVAPIEQQVMPRAPAPHR